MRLRTAARATGLVAFLALGLMATSAPSALATVPASDLPTEVRVLGMGGAVVGLADDESAARYNPAGLGYLSGGHVNAAYESQFGASSVFSLLGALPHFGGGLRVLSVGGIEGRDADDEVTSAFSYTDIAFTAANGWALSDLGLGIDSLALGSRLKADVASTRDGGGFGGGLDLGLLWRGQRPGFLPVAEMRAGLALANAPGTGPFAFKTGLSVRPISELTVALDFGVPFEFHLGSEFSIAELPSPLSRLDLRAGTFMQGEGLALTFGLGVGVASFRVDYAFASHPVLPSSHRLAIVWTF